MPDPVTLKRLGAPQIPFRTLTPHQEVPAEAPRPNLEKLMGDLIQEVRGLRKDLQDARGLPDTPLVREIRKKVESFP